MKWPRCLLPALSACPPPGCRLPGLGLLRRTLRRRSLLRRALPLRGLLLRGLLVRRLLPCAAPLRGTCNVECTSGPKPEFLPILEDLFGELAVVHRRVQLERTEGRHAARLVVGARRVVDFEIEDVIVDDGEEEIGGVE